MSFPLAVSFLSCGFSRKSAGFHYLSSLQHILREIRNKEATRIRDAANVFARALLLRNRCFLAVSNPMNPGYFAEGSLGLPPVFILIRSKEMAATLREGDALLTTVAGEIPQFAKKQRADVVGLTSPDVMDDYSPEELKNIKTPGKIGDSAGLLIHSHLKSGNMLINLGGWGISAGSDTVTLAIVTALAGETYRRSEGMGRTGNYPPHDALLFLDTLINRLKKIKKRKENLHQSALLAGEKILKGGTLWLFDGKGMLAREIAVVSQKPGFAQVLAPMGITDGTLKEKDALIFASLSSNVPEEIHLLRMARGITNGIVTICPHEESGGYRLYKESPASLDNESPEKEGTVQFDNGGRTYLHTGAVMNCALFGALVGEISDYLDSRGKKR
jgi:uncharacterized phosphosugar-binding protein